MTGAERIRAAFAAAREDGRAALVPYVVAGRPDAEACARLVAEIAAAGADVVELGVPFSDPLADGPVIRDATRRALDAGVTVGTCLDIVRSVRSLGVTVPIVCMGYVNPLLAFGIEAFCAAAAEAGVDGLIVPDAGGDARLRAACDRAGLGTTLLATPLSSDERILELARGCTGFLYAVATAGTTGTRDEVAASTIDFLRRARRLLDEAGLDVPTAVGFGISTPEHVERLAPHVDGVVVGSALVELVEREPDGASDFVAALVSAGRAPRA